MQVWPWRRVLDERCARATGTKPYWDVLEMQKSVDRMNHAIADGDREAYRVELIRQADLRASLEKFDETTRIRSTDVSEEGVSGGRDR